MKVKQYQTDTYSLTDLEGLDPVSVYVTNYESEAGKIVIECYGESWTAFFGAMGCETIQQFIFDSHNDYLINKMLTDCYQTDFDEIEKQASRKGYDICAGNDVDIAFMATEMSDCFGPDWMLDLPRCKTSKYHYLSKILDAIKSAFKSEHELQAA